MAPLISVILPTCDRPQLLPRALASVLAQQEVELEVLVVDSNRETGPVSANPAVEEYLADSRVRVVSPAIPPTNVSESRNAGLDAAQGEWISYLDDDDEFLPGKLAGQLALAQSSGSPLVICGYVVDLGVRQRIRQCHRSEYAGDDCLVGVDYPTPLLFHRADPEVRFDPTVVSGQDQLFVIEYLIRQSELRVPCLTACGVVQHMAAKQRLSVVGREQVWRSYRLCLQRHGRHFSRSARRAYLAIGLLARAQGRNAGWSEYCHCMRRVAVTNGWRSRRLLINALARRLPGARRLVVT